MGILRTRPAFAPRDFALISPLDPKKEMLLYHPAGIPEITWHACAKCHCQIFVTFSRPGIVEERDLAAEGVDVKLADIPQGKIKVWHPNPEGYRENFTDFFRLQGLTIDAGQEGWDVGVFKEKGLIQYVNWLDDDRKVMSYERPFHHGQY